MIKQNLCLEVGFDLRKWTANNNDLQNYFDSKEKNENKLTKPDDITYSEEQFGTTNNDFKKVLGVECDLKNDEFVFQFNSFICLARSPKEMY